VYTTVLQRVISDEIEKVNEKFGLVLMKNIHAKQLKCKNTFTYDVSLKTYSIFRGLKRHKN